MRQALSKCQEKLEYQIQQGRKVLCLYIWINPKLYRKNYQPQQKSESVFSELAQKIQIPVTKKWPKNAQKVSFRIAWKHLSKSNWKIPQNVFNLIYLKLFQFTKLIGSLLTFEETSKSSFNYC